MDIVFSSSGLGTVLLVQAVGQTLLALPIAALLDIFHHRYHRRYLLHWSRSWLALALYLAGASAVGLSFRPGNWWFRLPAAGLELVGGYLQIVWLLLGTYGLARGREVSPRAAAWALAGGALLGGASVLSPDPGLW